MAKGRKTGGRQKGVRNKASADVRAMARVYTIEAIETLAGLLRSRNATVKTAAARELLDRGWGRPAQAVEVSGPDGGAIASQVEHVNTLTPDDVLAARRLLGMASGDVPPDSGPQPMDSGASKANEKRQATPVPSANGHH